MRLVECATYLTAIGVVSFLLGRMLPASWLHEDRFPFCAFRFEREGSLYNRLKIKLWQNKLPDMSRILPGILPEKRVDTRFAEKLPLMVKETCVAELIHVLLCFAGLYCISLWPGFGGKIVSVLYFAANVPFVLVQRYNRPRLIRLAKKQKRLLGTGAMGVRI